MEEYLVTPIMAAYEAGTYQIWPCVRVLTCIGRDSCTIRALYGYTCCLWIWRPATVSVTRDQYEIREETVNLLHIII